MKKLSTIWLCAFALILLLSSCSVVGGIFKAGIWVGIFLVVIVVVIVLWLINRGRS